MLRETMTTAVVKKEIDDASGQGRNASGKPTSRDPTNESVIAPDQLYHK